jgi:transposase
VTIPSHPLAFLLPGFLITNMQVDETHLTLSATATTPTRDCPRCGSASTSIHSHYTRTPRDLPLIGYAVGLVLHVRRFRCLNPACPTVTFAERLTGVLAPSAQRTTRLTSALHDLGLALGGLAGSRQSQRASMPASPATILRLVHRTSPVMRPTPRVLGIDDFALRCGRVYGTILVDGETHQPLDLLPDRTAETVSLWLENHPGVEIITRDRSTEYARGATDGAPQATQVADRWHVLGNLREALERLLDRLRPQLQSSIAASAPPDTPAPAISIYDRDRRRGTKDQVRQQASRTRRYALYAQVKQLQAAGCAIIQIARELHLSRQTVRKYMASDVFPEVARSPRQSSILDPYAAELQARWDAGCHDNRQLLQALRERGYGGSIRPIVQWTMLRRTLLPDYRPLAGRRPARDVEVFVPPELCESILPSATSLPASRRLVWLLLHTDERLDEDAKGLHTQLCQVPEVALACQLSQQFRVMVRDRVPEALGPWIEACRTSGSKELVSFAEGLEREAPIIRAALELPYSNGVTEGHVNRLKMIKRTAYGRAGFELLRRRVLAAT